MSRLTTLARTGRPTRRDGTGRRDIQGLRAVAVLAVVLNHLLGWPRGGFVGVDVFFVISGFLITGLLLREHGRTGHISFVGFYRRRIKRILPASVVVLLVTVLGARVIFVESRFQSTVVDSWWALVFSANWRFAAASTDYFEQNRPVSPVQHFWSLSVEEQFYLVWPWLMLAILGVLVRGRHRAYARRVLLATIVVVSTAAFAWAVHQSVANPEVAYFSTLTRVWELGVGAALAVGAPMLHRIPHRVRPALAWAGLLGILASLVVIGEASAFPAPAALLPVLTAALVIAAGTYADPHHQQPGLAALTNPVSCYLGDLSYSLYLWHFPVIVLLSAYVGSSTDVGFYLVAAAAMTLASVGSYHLVEQPLRYSPLLDRFESPTLRRAAYAAWWRRWRPSLSGAVAVVVLVLVAATVQVVVLSPGLAPAAEETSYRDAGEKPPPGKPSAQERLAHDIEVAAGATAWPELDPPIDEVVTQDAPPREVGAGCPESEPADDPTSCTFGRPGGPTMYVLGDSTAMALIPTVRMAYGDRFRIRGLTLSSCQIPVEKIYVSTKGRDKCRTHIEDSLQAVVDDEPDVVFLTHTYAITDRLASGAQGEGAIEEWHQGLQEAVDRISDSAGQVVVVSPPVHGVSLEECAGAVSTPGDCLVAIPEDYRLGRAAEETVSGDGVHYLATRDWFCTSDGRCPAFVGNTPVRRDDVHTSLKWSKKIAPLFKARVDQWLAPTDRA